MSDIVFFFVVKYILFVLNIVGKIFLLEMEKVFFIVELIIFCVFEIICLLGSVVRGKNFFV